MAENEIPGPFKIPPVTVEFVDWLPWFYLVMGIFFGILLTARR
jgi:hypothetical protein